jgi:acyl carrier protein
MQTEEIRSKIKKIVANVANLSLDDISDDASYIEDLGLDSLSALEVMVDVDYEFQYKFPEEEAQGVHTIEDTVQLVQRHLVAPAWV